MSSKRGSRSGHSGPRPPVHASRSGVSGVSGVSGKRKRTSLLPDPSMHCLDSFFKRSRHDEVSCLHVYYMNVVAY